MKVDKSLGGTLIVLLAGLYLTSPFWTDLSSVRLPEPNDDWDNILTLLEAQREAVLGGELPLWNRYPEGGAPLLANPESSIGSPLMWLLVWLPVQLQLRLWVVLHLLAGLWSFHRLGTVLRWSPQASAYGALVWLGASMFAERMHVGHLMWAGAAWLPLIIAAGLDPAPRRLKEASAALALIFLGGGHYLVFFGGICLVILRCGEQLETDIRSVASLGLLCICMYLAKGQLSGGILLCLPAMLLLFLPRRAAFFRDARNLLSALALTLGLTAFKLLPVLELLYYSSRFNGAEQEPVPALTLSEALLKQLGWLGRDPVAPHEDQFTFYHPIPWALALLGLWAQGRHRRGVALLLVFSLLWSLGDQSPVPVSSFLQALPGLSWLRYPPRASILTLLMLALLCADATTWLGSAAIRRTGQRLGSGGLAALSLCLVFSSIWMLKASRDSLGGLMQDGPWPVRMEQPPFARRVCSLPMYLVTLQGQGCINGFTPVPLVNARSVRGVDQPDYRGEVWLEDSSGVARLTAHSGQGLEIQLDEAQGRGVLLVNQSHFPGWHEQGGARTESRRGLTAIHLDGREGPYVLRYHSRFAGIGGIITLCTLAVLLRKWLAVRNTRHFSLDTLAESP